MPVGQDTLDWKRILTARRKPAAIKNYFVENEPGNDEPDRGHENRM
jgi:hypothetical protein